MNQHKRRGSLLSDKVRLQNFRRVVICLLFIQTVVAGRAYAQDGEAAPPLPGQLLRWNEILDRHRRPAGRSGLLLSPDQRLQLSDAIRARARVLSELFRLDPGRAIVLALPESSRRDLAALAPEAADQLEVHGEWEGRVSVVVEDDFTRRTSRTHVWIHSDGEMVEVHFVENRSDLVSGQSLRVSGLRLRSQIVATAHWTRAAQDYEKGCSPLGEQRAAALLLDTPSAPFAVTGLTRSSIYDSFFSPSKRSLDTYWREVSFGKTWVIGDVFGPFMLPRNYDSYDKANYSWNESDPLFQILTSAVNAASQSVPLQNYNRLFLFLPPPKLGGAHAWGTVCGLVIDIPGKGAHTTSVSWFVLPEGVYPKGSEPSVGALPHEAGHNLGLHHANSLDFGVVPVGPLWRESLEKEYWSLGISTEYGDWFANAGRGVWAHDSAVHKAKLGWLERPNQTLDVETGGTFRLEPYETRSVGLKAIRVRRGQHSDKWLWFEYRQPIGGDANIGYPNSGVFEGALVHYEDPTNPHYMANKSYLLDLTPGSRSDDFLDAALPAGATWMDPFTPLTIRAGKADAAGLDITVSYDEPCATVSPVTRYHSAGSETGTVQISALPGCQWIAASEVDWITITAGKSGGSSGTVTYSMFPNAGDKRTGRIFIGRHVFTVTQDYGSQAMPKAVGVLQQSPRTPATLPNRFQFRFSDPHGANDLRVVRALIGSGTNPGGVCLVEYNPVAKTVQLADDSGANWSVAVRLGSSESYVTLRNSQCSIDPMTGSSSVESDTLTLSLWFTFSESFLGTRAIYLSADDAKGLQSGWQRMGAIEVFFDEPPRLSGFVIDPPSGPQRKFGFSISDADGYLDVHSVNVTFENMTNGLCRCSVSLWTNPDRSPGDLSVVDDEAFQGPIVRIGSIGIAQSSLCAVDASEVIWSGSGNTVALTLPVLFTPNCPGTWDVIVSAYDFASMPGVGKLRSVLEVPATGCVPAFGTSGASVGAGKSLGNLSVKAGPDCSWLASSSVPWITILSGRRGTGDGPVQYSVEPNPGGAPRIGMLRVGGRSFNVFQTGQPSDRVLIADNGVVSGASFLRRSVTASAWMTIFGANLATTTREWRSSDFNGTKLPTQLDGVSVKFNGKPGYVAYVSPTQINVLTPQFDETGWMQIEVETPVGRSDPSGVQASRYATGSQSLFMFNVSDRRYVAALHADGAYVGDPDLFPGARVRPAKPGDLILLFGTGFGVTWPPMNPGELVSKPVTLQNTPTIYIGGKVTEIRYAGMIGPGLYQFNLVVPDVPDGDQPVTGLTQWNAYLWVAK